MSSVTICSPSGSLSLIGKVLAALPRRSRPRGLSGLRSFPKLVSDKSYKSLNTWVAACAVHGIQSAFSARRIRWATVRVFLP